MNKRIEELLKQSMTDQRGNGLARADYNKFAQLIVQECVDIASKEDFDVMMKEGYPCSQTAKKIQEYFGVG